eukprot:CAMPEP_0197422340 /NCGR_PEP_ID=MMETSP1170-20131217/15096_1 /TAXON_ID=54406 /ORGANISM="Sarcinochrysis sp, Strain CCMP770" /LENGTH=120 /DNA_ID=CAMNT_0042949671 /DNA_START=35 /DNA_END=397 /DNA_ORIENTATION=+
MTAAADDEPSPEGLDGIHSHLDGLESRIRRGCFQEPLEELGSLGRQIDEAIRRFQDDAVDFEQRLTENLDAELRRIDSRAAAPPLNGSETPDSPVDPERAEPRRPLPGDGAVAKSGRVWA